ncbi:MAG: Ig-like domain-containing protein [Flavicella sp.]
MKAVYYYFLTIVVLFSSLNCARKGRPNGGPKDTLSPVMVTAYPPYESVHFNSKKIKLQFDEYVKFKNLNKQLIISPPLKNRPEITPMGTASKTVVIKLSDTLKPETTYSINFGNSIIDNNEGNKLGAFKYVFSTGSFVDSLTIEGRVKDAFDKETSDNIAVMLYEINESFNDSIIYKEAPTYLANTLDSVLFDISNIKAGTYQLLALKDKNSNNKFDPYDDKIGFLTNPLKIPTDTIFELSLFKENPPLIVKRPIEKKIGKVIFGYKGDVKGLNIELLTQTPPGFQSILQKEKEKDTLNYWFTPFEADSLQFKLSKDSWQKEYTVMLRTGKKDSLSLKSGIKNTLHPLDTFYIESNLPMVAVDPSKIIVTDKDTLDIAFKTNLNASKTKLSFLFERSRNNAYQFDLLPNAIKGLFGKENDTLQYKIKTRDVETYGVLELQFKNNKERNLLIDLINKKGTLITKRTIKTSENIVFTDLEADTYQVRIVVDENKNNKWDTGNFLDKTQPEKVYYYPLLMKLKANWTINEVVDTDNITF